MPGNEVTLENIRRIMREEIVTERPVTHRTIQHVVHDEIVAERAVTQSTMQQAMREEIVAERPHTQETIQQTVREEIVAERSYTHQMVQQSMQQALEPVWQSIDNVRDMLTEDARAESTRLDRVDRRSLRTQRLLTRHLSNRKDA